MHLFIGGLALQIAWRDRAADRADQTGALEKIGEQPLGHVLLWFFVIGFAGLGLTQLAITARRYGYDRNQMDRGVALPIAFWYLGLAVLAGSYAIGRGAGDGGGQYDVTADIFSWLAGRYLVGAVGVVVVAVGMYHAHKGWWRQHRADMHDEDRAGTSGDVLIRIGQFGYLAKGVALTVTGVLVIVAAVQYDPRDATGLDHGLRSFTDHPAGPALLTVVGLGIASFGIYLLAMTRRGKL